MFRPNRFAKCSEYARWKAILWAKPVLRIFIGATALQPHRLGGKHDRAGTNWPANADKMLRLKTSVGVAPHRDAGPVTHGFIFVGDTIQNQFTAAQGFSPILLHERKKRRELSHFGRIKKSGLLVSPKQFLRRDGVELAAIGFVGRKHVRRNFRMRTWGQDCFHVSCLVCRNSQTTGTEGART